MPHITHVALWTQQLEDLRDFYVRYFEGVAGDRYTNPRTGFSSYFVTFADDTRLELMARPDIASAKSPDAGEQVGWAHLAFSVGDESAVDRLTETLRAAGYRVVGEPRRTGDGYYESVVLDPDGNRLEITV